MPCVFKHQVLGLFHEFLHMRAIAGHDEIVHITSDDRHFWDRRRDDGQAVGSNMVGKSSTHLGECTNDGLWFGDSKPAQGYLGKSLRE